MIAKELINYMIPPLKPTDEVDKAVMWMEELRVSELPVVDEGKFLGILNEDLIFDNNSDEGVVQNLVLTGNNSFLNEQSHYYEILKMSYDESVSLVAILDTDDKYLGVVSIKDVVEAFAQTSSITSPGAIFILSMNSTDYSLTEISRLVESNDAKIISSHTAVDADDPSIVRLTLKINTEDASKVLATLERFGYSVVSQFNNQSSEDNDKDRYDILMKYLQI
ncbi:MAG: CBS domain-containing protein [Cyclobacteriaceae bacterium]